MALVPGCFKAVDVLYQKHGGMFIIGLSRCLAGLAPSRTTLHLIELLQLTAALKFLICFPSMIGDRFDTTFGIAFNSAVSRAIGSLH